MHRLNPFWCRDVFLWTSASNKRGRNVLIPFGTGMFFITKGNKNGHYPNVLIPFSAGMFFYENLAFCSRLLRVLIPFGAGMFFYYERLRIASIQVGLNPFWYRDVFLFNFTADCAAYIKS